LLAALDGNYPVLVLQNLGLDMAPQWHYAVVTGYDIGSRQIILNSGVEKNHRLGMSRFEHSWRRGGYWGLLATTPDSIPALADPIDWNRAVLESEQTGQTLVAFKAYQAALRRWPNNSHALLGLGNTAYALQRFPVAAESFYRLANIDGEHSAIGWNNLAYALLSLKCLPEARQAGTLAVSLEPRNQSILATTKEIELLWEAADSHGEGAHSRSEHCEVWRQRLAK
jgi:tetratricopeptide (TPR) repeat protein